MTRGRKVALVVVVVVGGVAAAGVVGWIAYGVLHTLRHLPDAYAAWDTGTLLTAYMERHDDRWPGSWDDLLTVLDSADGRALPLRGARAGDLAYARSLRERVSVDWSFDPASPGANDPVRSRDGGKLALVWEGAEPNELVRSYLSGRASTRPSAVR